jgi:hypothetical protein
VSQGDAAVHLRREGASGAQSPKRFAGEVHTDEDPDPAARHVSILSLDAGDREYSGDAARESRRQPAK